MQYTVWQVFTNQGAQVRFYIINLGTKQVQSTWKSYLEAKVTSDNLNRAKGPMHSAK